MTDTEHKQNPYAILEQQQNPVADSPETINQTQISHTVSQNNKQEDTPPVQNMQVSGADTHSIVDTIIKVVIDIVARLTGQPSPTGGKLPTLSK
jgi:hypothetical protein